MIYKSLCVSLVSMVAFVASAQEMAVPTSARQSLTMTIYNQGVALVKDSRRIDLKQGQNSVAFKEISDQIMAETALVKGPGVSALEQNYNFDLMNYESLLKKAVGSTVDVEWVNPATGETIVNKAQLLAYNGYGDPVLKIGSRIDAKYPGRVVFNSIPKNLWSEPTLILTLMNKEAGIKDVELSYLTNGLTWKADYVAELNAAEDKLDLNGLVTLTNNTQGNYENATLQLVAGDVNFSRKVRQVAPRAMAKGAMMEMAVMDSNMASEAVGDYYLYTMARPTDILPNQTKQVSLLSGTGVKVQKQYKLKDTINVSWTTEFKNIKPDVYLNFDNKKETGLGLPLPKGTIRVYKKDSADRLIFIGEDNINHTANNEKIELRLGTAFDLTVEGRRTSYEKLGSDYFEVAYEVAFKSALKTTSKIRFEQSLPDTWKIVSESQKSRLENANKIYWDIEIPPEGKTVLTFKVQVNQK